MKTFLFYDLETFGLNPKYDRIAQCAMIRTDMSLNTVGDPILLYCSLTPDYVPSPGACLVTGITPQTVNQKGIIEEEFIKIIRNEMMKPNTITVGYNNIKFDDECIRTVLYRNLYNPYEREYSNGCSRWDILNLIRACKDLRPDGINFSILNEETGATSFKLTDLTEENNIPHIDAHDALSDVRATIGVCRLIKEKQPKLFNYALRIRGKNEIIDELDLRDNKKPFLLTSTQLQGEKGMTHPLSPLFIDKDNTYLYAYDLLSDKAITDLSYEGSGVVQIHLKKCPFVAPLSVLDQATETRLGFKRVDIEKKNRELIESLAIPTKELMAMVPKREKQSNIDPDIAIYDSPFLTKHDQFLAEEIRALPPRERLTRKEHLFNNDNLHTLLWRQTVRNHPEVLDKKGLEEYRSFCASRLISPPTEDALTLEKYLRNLDEEIANLDRTPKEKEVLKALKDYGLRLKEKVFA